MQSLEVKDIILLNSTFRGPDATAATSTASTTDTDVVARDFPRYTFNLVSSSSVPVQSFSSSSSLDQEESSTLFNSEWVELVQNVTISSKVPANYLNGITCNTTDLFVMDGTGFNFSLCRYSLSSIEEACSNSSTNNICSSSTVVPFTFKWGLREFSMSCSKVRENAIEPSVTKGFDCNGHLSWTRPYILIGSDKQVSVLCADTLTLLWDLESALPYRIQDSMVHSATFSDFLNPIHSLPPHTSLKSMVKLKKDEHEFDPGVAILITFKFAGVDSERIKYSQFYLTDIATGLLANSFMPTPVNTSHNSTTTTASFRSDRDRHGWLGDRHEKDKYIYDKTIKQGDNVLVKSECEEAFYPVSSDITITGTFVSGTQLTLVERPLHRLLVGGARVLLSCSNRALTAGISRCGSIYLYKHKLQSNFPGISYPAGYTVMMQQRPYFESEDELDRVVLNSKQSEANHTNDKKIKYGDTLNIDCRVGGGPQIGVKVIPRLPLEIQNIIASSNKRKRRQTFTSTSKRLLMEESGDDDDLEIDEGHDFEDADDYEMVNYDINAADEIEMKEVELPEGLVRIVKVNETTIVPRFFTLPPKVRTGEIQKYIQKQRKDSLDYLTIVTDRDNRVESKLNILRDEVLSAHRQIKNKIEAKEKLQRSKQLLKQKQEMEKALSFKTTTSFLAVAHGNTVDASKPVFFAASLAASATPVAFSSAPAPAPAPVPVSPPVFAAAATFSSSSPASTAAYTTTSSSSSPPASAAATTTTNNNNTNTTTNTNTMTSSSSSYIAAGDCTSSSAAKSIKNEHQANIKEQIDIASVATQIMRSITLPNPSYNASKIYNESKTSSKSINRTNVGVERLYTCKVCGLYKKGHICLNRMATRQELINNGQFGGASSGR